MHFYRFRRFFGYERMCSPKKRVFRVIKKAYILILQALPANFLFAYFVKSRIFFLLFFRFTRKSNKIWNYFSYFEIKIHLCLISGSDEYRNGSWEIFINFLIMQNMNLIVYSGGWGCHCHFIYNLNRRPSLSLLDRRSFCVNKSTC